LPQAKKAAERGEPGRNSKVQGSMAGILDREFEMEKRSDRLLDLGYLRRKGAAGTRESRSSPTYLSCMVTSVAGCSLIFGNQFATGLVIVKIVGLIAV
jgi:hypothetical protein